MFFLHCIYSFTWDSHLRVFVWINFLSQQLKIKVKIWSQFEYEVHHTDNYAYKYFCLFFRVIFLKVVFPHIYPKDGIFEDIISVIFYSWLKRVIPTSSIGIAELEKLSLTSEFLHSDSMVYIKPGFIIICLNAFKSYHKIQITLLWKLPE